MTTHQFIHSFMREMALHPDAKILISMACAALVVMVLREIIDPK